MFNFLMNLYYYYDFGGSGSGGGGGGGGGGGSVTVTVCVAVVDSFDILVAVNVYVVLLLMTGADAVCTPDTTLLNIIVEPSLILAVPPNKLLNVGVKVTESPD